MTYSAPLYHEHFGSEFPDNYKLYQYVDRRLPDLDQISCIADPVLFVPGHWGTHEQGRSLGSVGLGFGGLHDKPKKWDIYKAFKPAGGADQVERTFFSTYILDFNEEGTAFHSTFVKKQAIFFSESVDHILSTTKLCSTNQAPKSVTVIGHSMGGIVARYAIATSDDLVEKVRTVITLATPHVTSPANFDDGMSDVYALINGANNSGDEDVAVLSISAGRRDELVAAEIVDTSKAFKSNPGKLQSSRTVHLDNVSQSRNVGERNYGVGGCDHKAIVWCKELLTNLVPGVLESFKGADLGGGERLDRILEALSVEGGVDYVKVTEDEDRSVQEANNGWAVYVWRAIRSGPIFEKAASYFVLNCVFWGGFGAVGRMIVLFGACEIGWAAFIFGGDWIIMAGILMLQASIFAVCGIVKLGGARFLEFAGLVGIVNKTRAIAGIFQCLSIPSNYVPSGALPFYIGLKLTPLHFTDTSSLFMRLALIVLSLPVIASLVRINEVVSPPSADRILNLCSIIAFMDSWGLEINSSRNDKKVKQSMVGITTRGLLATPALLSILCASKDRGVIFRRFGLSMVGLNYGQAWQLFYGLQFLVVVRFALMVLDAFKLMLKRRETLRKRKEKKTR